MPASAPTFPPRRARGSAITRLDGVRPTETDPTAADQTAAEPTPHRRGASADMGQPRHLSPTSEATAELIALRRRSGLAWPRGTNTVVDLAFVVTVILTFAGVATVFAFHLSFALLTVMSFIHNSRNLLIRAVPAVALVVTAVARAVANGVLLVDELYEIPILLGMMAVAGWSMQLHGRLLGELNEQTTRVRQLHAASQLEYREQLILAQRLEGFGQLSAGVAHNLRNLLTAVLSMAEHIEDDTESDQIRSQAQRIQTYTTQGGELITNMLHHARPGRTTMSVDLVTTVANEHSSLDILTGADIELVMDLPDVPLPVQTSQSLVEQILVNLVLNARDAIDGTGQITVKVAPGELPGPQAEDRVASAAVLSVTDTGRGMPPEVQERAFEPFFSTKADTDGAGLGLYSVLVITEDAGGTVQITSDRDRGTTLAVTLPQATGEGDEPTTVVAHTDLRPEKLFGSERVLVIDDDEPSLERLCTALTLYGYETTSASSGIEGLEVLERHQFDLVVTDIMMPGMDGIEMVKRARARGLTSAVLFTSAFADATTVLPSDARLLAKPFSRTMFLARVRDALDVPVDVGGQPVG